MKKLGMAIAAGMLMAGTTGAVAQVTPEGAALEIARVCASGFTPACQATTTRLAAAFQGNAAFGRALAGAIAGLQPAVANQIVDTVVVVSGPTSPLTVALAGALTDPTAGPGAGFGPGPLGDIAPDLGSSDDVQFPGFTPPPSGSPS